MEDKLILRWQNLPQPDKGAVQRLYQQRKKTGAFHDEQALQEAWDEYFGTSDPMADAAQEYEDVMLAQEIINQK